MDCHKDVKRNAMARKASKAARGNPLFAARFAYLLFAVLVAASLFSCRGRGKIAEIDFPPTFVVEAENRFAVVTQPYAVLLDEPGDVGVTLGHCRRGDVFAVTATRFAGPENDRALWVCLEGGWLLREYVILFSSRAQAEEAAQSMMN